MIRVNGTTYKWLGDDPAGNNTSAKVTNIQITPTRSIFVMTAGPMNVTVTFLSPVEPDDWVKQSIPFSYVSVEAQSLDGNSYSVQMYSDISAEWDSGDRNNPIITWSNASTTKSMYHQIQLQKPAPYTEITNQAQDGTTYYAISTVSTIYIYVLPCVITSQMDFLSVTRNQFQTKGVLTNAGSTAFTTITPYVVSFSTLYPRFITYTTRSRFRTFPVFALAVDLGTIKATDSPVTWSVGFVHDPSILYTTAAGNAQVRRPYYVTQYTRIEDVSLAVQIDAVTSNFLAALARAVALDQKIMGDATRVHSSQYADIVALSTRQTMGALDITVGTDSNGTVVPGDIMVFMRNTGTDRRANPVERIYAAFPMFLYLNASLGGALLSPLLAAQPASLSGQTYAAMDIGSQYPEAQGPSRVPQEGVEQSGNMLILMLAHARISGDGTLLSQYYDTAKRWADYLVGNALESQDQQNQDNGEASQMTNIALKGIIGVRVMAEIAYAVGEDSDATHYADQASSLLDSFLSRATSSDGSHLLGKYNDEQSWSSMYNIFADKMLGLNFVPQSAIDMHTQFLASRLESSGLPIDSDADQIANAAWVLFTSAFVSDSAVRDALIEGVHNHANFNQSAGVFPERYNASNGFPRNGFAGPSLGGLFSHLALTLPNKTISAASVTSVSVSASGRQPPGRTTDLRAVVGGVIGGLAVVAISVVAFFFLRRRCRQHRQRLERAQKSAVVRQVPTRHPTPFTYSQVATVGSTHGLDLAGQLDVAGGNRRKVVPPSSKPVDQRDPSLPAVSALPDIEAQTDLGSRTETAVDLDRNSLSTTEVVELRTEVENLRRVMQQFHAQRLEAPPEYEE
ncbi:hypothetical protein GSI_03291 [Ganoderma sinense ZZ0214-1]|uniref:DUF1793-domain-containing protein n=1 Tax=Ganoderma sinense ZZ0214-1 TaxID=1077348 RepID=A0A2G8SL94_9APHY|nr:hypothetical protein GSI_03291 [Ganoderma sinense ZZ0214-1]